MGKTNQVNPFEQHIEKIVLGISVLLLMYALIHWVSSSPRIFEVAGKTVAPGMMDGEIKNLHRQAVSSVDSAQPKSIAIVDDSSQLATRQNNPLGSSMGNMPNFGQLCLAEELGASEQTVSLADIRKAIVKLQTPRARVESEYPDKGGQPQDVLVAHVASVAAWKQMEEEFRKKNVGVPVVAAVEGEVRERLSDGSWSEPRAVKTVAMPPEQNNNQQSSPPVIPDYDQNNAETVHAIIGELDGWKDYILQPPYWQIWWPNNQWGEWTINLPMTSVSEAEKAAMKAEDEALKSSQAQPNQDQSTKKPSSVRNSRNSGTGAGGRGGRAGGRSSFSEDFLGGRPRDVMEGVRPPANLRPEKPTRQTRTQATPQGTARNNEETEIPAPEPTPLPDLKTQLENGQVVVWFHDESLESLKVYQYRMRLVVANPLVTSTDVKDPQDAVPGVIKGEWSDWSSPVSIPRPTQFFVTGHYDGLASNSSSFIRITVFSRVLGQYVKQIFGRVNEGDLVGSKIDAKVTDPNTNEQVKSKADFSTGAIMVHFDFRKVSSRGTKVDTVEVLYLDDKGNLRTRIREMDESGEVYKQRNGEAKPVGSAS